MKRLLLLALPVYLFANKADLAQRLDKLEAEVKALSILLRLMLL